MSKTFDLNSHFNITSNFTLSTDDLSTLSLLYAPLMGSDAYMLYMAFQALLERNNLKSETFTHKEFLSIYSFKENDFLKARYKLEGIGLLISYLDDNHNYLYIICPPLTPRNFLKDATIGLYLYAKLDENVFNIIYNHFKIEKVEKGNYQNVTKAFDEVFESRIDSDKTYEKFSYILGRKANQNIKITNSSFDFDKFLKNIDTALLETGVTTNFNAQIKNIAFVYGFDEGEMISLFNDSINKSGYYDYRLLKRRANTLFTYKRNMKAPMLEAKENGEVANTDLIDWLENAAPVDILSAYSPNFSEKMLDTITDIYANIDLPRGVLNVMIIKVINDKGELPAVKYFEKMSKDWVSHGVLSTPDAVKYSTSLQDEKTTDVKSGLRKEGFDEL